MAALGNRSVFRRHPEGIEAHRVEHIKAHQALKSGNCIPNGIISDVTHVHFSRGIRVHLKTVELGAVAVNIGMKKLSFIPLFLPANLVYGGRFG